MRSYEIYWSDLTPEAQARLAGLHHSNIELSPLAIVDIEQKNDSHKTLTLLYRDKTGRDPSPREVITTVGDLLGYSELDAGDEEIDTNDDGLTLWEWADQAEPGDTWETFAESYLLIAIS